MKLQRLPNASEEMTRLEAWYKTDDQVSPRNVEFGKSVLGPNSLLFCF